MIIFGLKGESKMKTVKEKSLLYLQFANKDTDLEKIWQEIVEMHSTPTRFYHTLGGHIDSCLNELESARDWIERSYPYSGCQMNNYDFYCSLGLALLLHDIVMDFMAKDNEEISAVFAFQMLGKMGFKEAIREKVPNLIMDTKHLFPADSFGGKLVADVDLASMGQDEATWLVTEKNIRQEYAFVPENVFREGRRNILQGFLNKKRIFQTEFFFDKYEDAARKNLAASVERLS
jgi:predicted metal-dependent HD superfamily phosphohydrolase